MTRHGSFALSILLALALAGPAAASDKIRLLTGQMVDGEVVEMNPKSVKIDKGGVPKTFQVNQIESIQFDDEPKELTGARNSLRSGKLADAMALIRKAKIDDVKRDITKQDVEFYRAYILGRWGLAGNGSLEKARKMMVDFENAHKNNYHYWDATAMLGDLRVATGQFDKAEESYGRLASTPWPEYRIRSAVLVGRALEAQKKFDKAVGKYDEALAIDGDGKEMDAQRLAAQLGKATALAGSGKNDEAVKLIQAVIDKADVDDQELYARAYVALGNCYKAAGKPKDALLAFLEVDLLYPEAPEQHAEALANLATLWTKVDKADRAKEARAQLQERYPQSRWNKGAAEAKADDSAG